MDWFLYDNGLRHERVKQLRFCEKKKNFVANGSINFEK